MMKETGYHRESRVLHAEKFTNTRSSKGTIMKKYSF